MSLKRLRRVGVESPDKAMRLTTASTLGACLNHSTADGMTAQAWVATWTV